MSATYTVVMFNASAYDTIYLRNSQYSDKTSGTEITVIRITHTQQHILNRFHLPELNQMGDAIQSVSLRRRNRSKLTRSLVKLFV